MATVQIELPEELLRTANVSGEQPSLEVAKLIALELFRQHAVSLGRAAELCGIPVEELMRFAAEREVPLHYSLEDLESDRETVKCLPLN